MTKVKVIIKPSFGSIELTPEFQQALKDAGHESRHSIEARTDPKLVALVEAGSVAIEDWTYLKVVEVDTSKPWYIGNYDGAESISYLEYDMIDPSLNFIQMK